MTTTAIQTNMGLGKKTIKLVDKLLKDENKRKMYSDEELTYMERQVEQMKLDRKRRKEQRKRDKGFGYS